MKNAIQHLLDIAKSKGFAVRVVCEDECDYAGFDMSEAYTAIEDVEEATINFINEHGKYVGWAVVSTCDLGDDEMVIDHTDIDWMNEAAAQYSAIWDGMRDNEGQPTEYEEWQDYMGGDDWDHGQYDD